MSLMMAEQLKRAGFKVDLNVVDWATLVQRRNDSKLWDIYITHSGQFPEPMLSPPQLGDGAPGWWDRRPPRRPRCKPSTRRATRQARRAVGQGAAGGVRRGAVHQRRQVQRPVGQVAGAGQLRALELAVLLEREDQVTETAWLS
jgi:hypothetical protein